MGEFWRPRGGTDQPASEGGQVDGAVADGDGERVPRGPLVHPPVPRHPRRRRRRLDPAAVHRRRRVTLAASLQLHKSWGPFC